MLNYLLTDGSDWRGYIIQLLLSLPIILFALSLHEAAHGYIASRLGDPTAKSLGRLTVNPFKHLDPLGFLCMVLFGFGWAHPVPINSRFFKKPRRDMALTALAGPVSNLLAAAVFAVIYGLGVFLLNLALIKGLIQSATLFTFLRYVTYFLYYGVSLNVTLAVFNLIPIPPLDGSRIICAFLPPKAAFGYMKYERFLSLGLLALLFISPVSNLLHEVMRHVTDLFLLLSQLTVNIATLIMNLIA